MPPDPFFTPVSGMDLPRFAGVPSFMRLPVVPDDHPRAAEVEIGLLGIPFDGGTSNRPGARHGPRALRDASTMLRAVNGATGRAPFAARRCADLGDVAVNPVDGAETLARIAARVGRIAARGTRVLAVGGDHLVTLGVLRGLVPQTGPLGLILFDSHTDLYPPYFGGSTLTHGNPFRVAVEEGLIDPARATMIGMRGTAYDSADRDFAAACGIRVVTVEELFDRGLAATMAEARARAAGLPTYASFDIDFVDPAFAPGTGTPEVGGPTSREALAAVRGLSGVTVAAADLVEVSPPFDTGGITAWLGASVLFELLCQMG